MAKNSEDWNNFKKILYYQSFFYILRIIWAKFISRHYDNLPASYFDIEKIYELVTQKYY